MPDAEVPRGGVHVTLTTRGGATIDIRQEHARGTPALPATRAQIEDRFLQAASPRLPATLSAGLLAGLRGLDGVADCADLLRRCREVGVGPGTAGSLASRG